MEKFDGLNLVMLFAGALPCILFGYLIAIKRKWHLIAGWDESKVTNPAAFANMVGGSILFEGITLSAISIAEGTGVISDTIMISALLAIVMIPIVVLIIATRRYRKKSDFQEGNKG